MQFCRFSMRPNRTKHPGSLTGCTTHMALRPLTKRAQQEKSLYYVLRKCTEQDRTNRQNHRAASCECKVDGVDNDSRGREVDMQGTRVLTLLDCSLPMNCHWMSEGSWHTRPSMQASVRTAKEIQGCVPTVPFLQASARSFCQSRAGERRSTRASALTMATIGQLVSRVHGFLQETGCALWSCR